MENLEEEIGPRPGKLRTRLLHRRLKVAARLFASRKINRLDYAAIAVATICELSGTKPENQEFNVSTFGITAAMVLGFDISQLQSSALEKYGPLREGPFTLGQAFSIDSGTGDQYNPQQMQFRWGRHSTKAFRLAKLRLRAHNRWAERVDSWRAEQAELTPNLHADLWKGLIAMVAGFLGFLLGRLSGS